VVLRRSYPATVYVSAAGLGDTPNPLCGPLARLCPYFWVMALIGGGLIVWGIIK